MKELQNISLRSISIHLLVITFYVKFLFQIILELESQLVLDLILYVLIFTSIDFSRVKLRVLYIMVPLFIFSLFNGAARNIFLVILTMYILKDWRIRYFALINFVMGSLLLIISYFLLEFDILKEVQFQNAMSIDTRVRFDFGFGNPNTFAIFIFSVLANFYICLYQKYKKITLVIITTIAYFVFMYTGSRAFIASVALLVFVSLVLYRRTFNIIKWIAIISPIIVYISLFYAIFNISSFKILDLLLSGRLSLYSASLIDLSPLEYLIGTTRYGDDSSYLQIIYQSGLIGVIIFIVVYSRNLYRWENSSKYIYFLPIIVSYCAYGVAESLVIYILTQVSQVINHPFQR